uniref:Uncharacterized protein n=1 Tax=Romanomermis culicivorax TaxID=13658 RepID=A0A915IKS6_ROMCU
MDLHKWKNDDWADVDGLDTMNIDGVTLAEPTSAHPNKRKLDGVRAAKYVAGLQFNTPTFFPPVVGKP